MRQKYDDDARICKKIYIEFPKKKKKKSVLVSRRHLHADKNVKFTFVIIIDKQI